MKIEAGGKHGAEKLRRYAEQQLPPMPEGLVDKEFDETRLRHELQVHQIELEMQIEALRDARTLAEESLSLAVRTQESYVELFDFAPMAYCTISRQGIILSLNFRAEQLLNKKRGQISGQCFTTSVVPEFRTVFNRFLECVFSGGSNHRREICLLNGEHCCWVTIEAIADFNRQTCLVAMLDITEQKKSQQYNQLAAIVYQTLREAVMVTDGNNRIISVNPAFTSLTGYSELEAIGQTSKLLKSGLHDEVYYRAMWDSLNSSGFWEGEIWSRRKNGDVFVEWLTISTAYDDQGEVTSRVGMYSDLTGKKYSEKLIRFQANFDSLTQLPNRRLLLERLQEAIHQSHSAQQKFALLYLDLDNFKDVNDSLGHEFGDNLLKELAARLKKCIRETDTLAKPGSDEFIIIIGEFEELGTIECAVLNIHKSMNMPLQLWDERCHIGSCIGVSIYPEDSRDADDLLKKAEQALYSAKQQGRNHICYFTPQMQATAEKRLRIANDLRYALGEQQFFLAYQPIVELATGQIQKAEALIRWRHPQLGLINPAEFIPIAEDTGAIIEIGDWVFRQAARQVQQWRRQYSPDFQISINKSPVQFHDKRTDHDDWFSYLSDLGLPGESLVLEITEGLLLDAASNVTHKLLAFRGAGVKVSLDDFGTGYSSLSYLKKFEIDYLKIDQMFIRHLSENATDQILCEAMILMAHKLGIKVIAEGIETEQQRDFLLQAGCDFGQGYLFSKPLSVDDFAGLMAF